MISQIDPYGEEMFVVSHPRLRATFESSIVISFWRLLRRRIGKKKKSTQAWFEKLNLAGNTIPPDILPFPKVGLSLSLEMTFSNTIRLLATLLEA